MSRRLLVLLALSVAAYAAIVELVTSELRTGLGPPLWVIGGDAAIGVSFLVAGIIAWWRRPTSRVGALMIAVGLTWAVFRSMKFTNVGLFIALEAWLGALPFAILVHLLLAFPTGRISSRLGRILTLAAYADVVVGNLIVLAFLHQVYDPRSSGLPADFTPLYVFRGPGRGLDLLHAAVSLCLAVAVSALFVRRWSRASKPARRVIAPIGWALVVMGATFILATIAVQLPSVALEVRFAVYAALGVAIVLVPVAFLVGLLRSQIARSAVGDLVIELADSSDGGRLGDAIARTLGDPSATVAYWLPERGVYVDEEGTPVSLPDQGSGRAVTVLKQQGVPVAALVYDVALSDEPRFLKAVGAAARLAVDNERLHAALRARLDEIRASRARIVEAGDTERQRIERDLHDGAQQRLVGISLALRVATSRVVPGNDPELDRTLAEASTELTLALNELRELARGIHPAVLTEEGLGPALESLAERANVPVVLAALPRSRQAIPVEAAAYFVVSEALANVAKHAQATRATISATEVDGRLIVEITDDGIGGADFARGAGMRGLADRVAALDGCLRVTSPRGEGTTVHAEIPCVP